MIDNPDPHMNLRAEGGKDAQATHKETGPRRYGIQIGETKFWFTWKDYTVAGVFLLALLIALIVRFT